MRKNLKVKRFLNWYVSATHNVAIKPKPTLLSNLFTIFLLVAFSLIMVCLHGCSSSDSTPLESLASQNASQKYDYNFWLNESKSKTDLWGQAQKFCKQEANASNINCKNIVQISVLMNINTEWPTYNANNEGFGKIPEVKNS